ncbi:MAG TPA: hypothetical protein VGI56_03320 [Galbitalea sp.]
MPATRRPSTAHQRAARLWILGCLAAVLAIVATALVPLSAEAASPQLVGTVTGPTGNAIAGLSVAVVTFPVDSSPAIAATTTSTTGSYAFSTLANGTYTLRFGASATTYTQYLGDTSDGASAKSFDVSATDHHTINAALLASGTISGSVKTTTHVALQGYTVRAYANGSDQTPVRSAVTSLTGSYSITGLEPGSYQLQVLLASGAAAYGPGYSGGATSLDAASALEVIAGKTTAYSFTLGKAGAISGTVTGNSGSTVENLAGVVVTPYRLEGPYPSFTGHSSLGLRSTLTKTDGTYSLTGLAPGYYTLEFAPRTTAPLPASNTIYGREFLGNHNDGTLDTPFLVTAGTTLQHADVELYPGDALTGQVVDNSQLPTIVGIPNIPVTLDHDGALTDQPSNGAVTTTTDAQGNFSFPGLASGFYQVAAGSNTSTDPAVNVWQRKLVGGSYNVSYKTDPPLTTQIALDKKPVGGLQTVTPTLISNYGVEVGYQVIIPHGDWNADDVDPAKETFQWLRNGVPIPGATHQTYILQANDYGTMISARTTAYDFTYGSGSSDSAAIGPITAGTLYANSGGGYLAGTSQVGRTLKYASTGWNVSGVTESLQWQTSPDGNTWTNIPGATGPTHTETADDLANGPYIRIEVTASHFGYTTFVYDSPPDGVQPGVFKLVTAPTVSTSSTTWTASAASWSPNVGSTKYLWEVDGVPATPHSDNASLPRAGTSGKYVTVEVFRENDGYTPYFAPRITVQLGAAPVASAPLTVTGTPVFGSPLTAIVPSFTPAPTSTTCAWQYKSGTSWKSVVGGTTCNYTPTVADIGHMLRLTVRASKTGYATKTLMFAEPTPVVAAPMAVSVAPSISGTPGTALVLSANTGTWTPSPTSFTYQWKYSATGLAPFTKAPGTSTGSTYRIPQSLLGKKIAVDVTAHLAGHATVTATVAASGPVTPGYRDPVSAPKVTVSGTTLSASGATFSPAAPVTYNWFVYDLNDSPGPATVSPTFPFGSHLHAHIGVQAVANAVGGYQQTFGPIILARKGGETTASTLTVTGGTVGVATTASPISWSIANSTLTYAWQYQSGTSWLGIPGASSPTWAPTAAYFAKHIRLVETASHVNYNSASVISNSLTITNGSAPVAGSGAQAPSIGGANVVGSKLTAHPGTWSIPGVTFGYQWKTSPDGSNWTTVGGATSSTFVVPVAAMATWYVGVQITASRTGYLPGTVFIADPGQSGSGQFAMTKAPAVTAVGTVLSVSPGTWSPMPTEVHYAWHHVSPGGVADPIGGDSPTYTPTIADAGYEIAVTVTVKKTGYADSSATVTARGGGAITALTPVNVSGTPTTGQQLTAGWTFFSVVSPTVTYQWYRSGVVISGATSQNYTPVAADVGKKISVVVTVTKSGWTTTKFTAVGAVEQSGTSLGYSVNPTVSGSPTVDSVLTVTPGIWSTSGLAFTYQWTRGGNDIPGATGTKYTVTANDLSDDILVIVTAKKPYYDPRVAASAPVTIGLGAPLAPATPVKITGTVGLGKLLTASYGAWNYPVTLTFEWQYNTPVNPMWQPISGAAGSTYTPNLPEVGHADHIQLIVHASRPGHASVDLVSAAVTVP